MIAPWLRRSALVVAILRYAVPLAAIPLIPFLLRERIVLLVALRPTKEFLLLGGGQARVVGEPPVAALFAAYLPLMVVAVWAFFIVGRAYRTTLRDGEGPRWLHRAVPPAQFEIAQRVLARRGPTIAVLGRIAALPPTVMAAAAGASDVSARRYLAADVVGALVAFALAVGAGYGLGQAYERGGVWLTAAGVALLVALLLLLTRWLRAEANRPEAKPVTPQS